MRTGMAELAERLLAQGSADDADATFLRAAAQLREMAQLAPERNRAVERFKSEATEENWLEVQRLSRPEE